MSLFSLMKSLAPRCIACCAMQSKHLPPSHQTLEYGLRNSGGFCWLAVVPCAFVTVVTVFVWQFYSLIHSLTLIQSPIRRLQSDMAWNSVTPMPWVIFHTKDINIAKDILVLFLADKIVSFDVNVERNSLWADQRNEEKKSVSSATDVWKIRWR